jgi:hypothetical protein
MLYINDIPQDVWKLNEACGCRNTIHCWIAKEAEVMELHGVRKGVSGHLFEESLCAEHAAKSV